MENLTTQAHNICRAVLQPSDIAIDATAGNGHDTLFLAQQVGPEGTVYGFDVQASAIATTARRMAEAGIEHVTLFEADHAEMQSLVPERHCGAVAVVMFNLGYLPGGDKSLVTNSAATLSAIEQSLLLLRSEGVLTVLAYTGHAGGQTEADAVKQLLASLDDEQSTVTQITVQKECIAPPLLFVVRKL